MLDAIAHLFWAGKLPYYENIGKKDFLRPTGWNYFRQGWPNRLSRHKLYFLSTSQTYCGLA